MMKFWVILLLLQMSIAATMAAPVTPMAKATAYKSVLVPTARRLLEIKDYLGFRIYIRRAYAQKMNLGEWFLIKNMISANADRVGFDLIPFWNARNKTAASEIDNQLYQVDRLMQARQFEQAFVLAQSVAQKIKILQKTRTDAQFQLPYIYHSMARALYGAQRYDEALKVYQWISPTYPYFVQTLFEKMWAAFKAGRVDLALGAVASQRSAYFNQYLSPESYLVQTYLYRKLCRDDDQKQVVEEMKAYEAILAKKDSQLSPVTDIATLALSLLAKLPSQNTDNVKLVSLKDREKEQKDIQAAISNSVNSRRDKVLKDLRNVIAYQQLSNQSDSKTVLKPVESMKSRDELLKKNLEVWPVDGTEEWMDEVGKHVLIGESHCKSQK